MLFSHLSWYLLDGYLFKMGNSVNFFELLCDFSFSLVVFVRLH